jgi:hypothetical protein
MALPMPSVKWAVGIVRMQSVYQKNDFGVEVRDGEARDRLQADI